MESTQIDDRILLFVPNSIKASCKEIIPSLQEIVALLLFIGFPFTAEQLQLLKGCYLGPHWDCYPSQREMPPLSQRGAIAFCYLLVFMLYLASWQSAQWTSPQYCLSTQEARVTGIWQHSCTPSCQFSLNSKHCNRCNNNSHMSKPQVVTVIKTK